MIQRENKRFLQEKSWNFRGKLKEILFIKDSAFFPRKEGRLFENFTANRDVFFQSGQRSNEDKI